MAQEIVDPVGYPRVGHILSVEDANCNVSVTFEPCTRLIKTTAFLALCAPAWGIAGHSDRLRIHRDEQKRSKLRGDLHGRKLRSRRSSVGPRATGRTDQVPWSESRPCYLSALF